MFGPDGIVVTSLTVTYFTVKNESKVNQGHFSMKPMRYYQDAPNELFWQ